MAADWFLAREGQQQPVGPLSGQQLKQMAAAGQIQPTDLVWKQGMTKWAQANQIKGLLDGTGLGESGVATGLRPAEEPAPREMNWQTEEPAARPPAGPPPGAGEAGGGVAYAPAEDRPPGVPEPWYYGFLEKYAKVGLYLGIAAFALFFGTATLVGVSAGVRWMNDAPLAGLATIGASLVCGVVFFGSAAVALVFVVALLLLAVDAARNLREARRKLEDRPPGG